MRKNEFSLVLILLKCDMPFLLQIKCKENQKCTDEMVGIMGFLVLNGEQSFYQVRILCFETEFNVSKEISASLLIHYKSVILIELIFLV